MYDHNKLASVRDMKYTQEVFSKMLGVTVVTLSRMENGHRASYDLIFRACQLLDIDSAKIIYSSRQLEKAS